MCPYFFPNLPFVQCSRTPILHSFRWTVISIFTVGFYYSFGQKFSHTLTNRSSTGDNSICASASTRRGNVCEYEILETSVLVWYKQTLLLSQIKQGESEHHDEIRVNERKSVSLDIYGSMTDFPGWRTNKKCRVGFFWIPLPNKFNNSVLMVKLNSVRNLQKRIRWGLFYT